MAPTRIPTLSRDGYFKLSSLKVDAGWIHRNLSAGAASTLYNLYFLGLTYMPITTLALDAQEGAETPARQGNASAWKLTSKPAGHDEIRFEGGTFKFL
jgi:hypothetical protein